MRRKRSWPFVALITFSFIVGTVWGLKLIRDRSSKEKNLESEARLRILAPPGIFSAELLMEFQRREKIEVELSTEHFPAALLRRALKSAPGQFDAVLVYHYQVSALRAERKLSPLYDRNSKFPTSIAPDFRKLPNDRNLMDTAPLLWGLLGTASKKEFEHSKTALGFWPSILIGVEDQNVTPSAFAIKLQPLLGNLSNLESNLKNGIGFYSGTPQSSVLVSHASLAFSPMKEAQLHFEPLKTGGFVSYPLWILTLAGLNEGDIDRTRKLVQFLLDPAQNVALIQHTRSAASTLRESNELKILPKNLQSNYLRTIPIDQILIERDERVRLADDVLEQFILGASVKIAKTVEKTVEPEKPAVPVAVSPATAPVTALKRKNAPEKSPHEVGIVVEKKAESPSEPEAAADVEPPPASAGPATAPTTAPPSEETPHDD